jgi:hypothetical protein
LSGCFDRFKLADSGQSPKTAYDCGFN